MIQKRMDRFNFLSADSRLCLVVSLLDINHSLLQTSGKWKQQSQEVLGNNKADLNENSVQALKSDARWRTVALYTALSFMRRSSVTVRFRRVRITSNSSTETSPSFLTTWVLIEHLSSPILTLVTINPGATNSQSLNTKVLQAQETKHTSETITSTTPQRRKKTEQPTPQAATTFDSYQKQRQILVVPPNIWNLTLTNRQTSKPKKPLHLPLNHGVF